MSVIAAPEDLPLGTTLPPGDPHGVSVHLPKWADTVGWASREARVLNAMKTGYPRFFIPRMVASLTMRLLEMLRGGQGHDGGPSDGRHGLIFTTLRHAQLCRKILPEWSPEHQQQQQQQQQQQDRAHSAQIDVYIVTWDGDITAIGEHDPFPNQAQPPRNIGDENIILVSYPAEFAAQAKAFWQHTGFGISSRRAMHWLESAPLLTKSPVPRSMSDAEVAAKVDWARTELRKRIAAGHSPPSDDSLRVSEDDVFLFPTGMTAIAETAEAIKSLRPSSPDRPYRVAAFGFLYVDTFKVLDRVLSFLPTLYACQPASLDDLERRLREGGSLPHLDALFTEFPGNPLLQSPDLARLRRLAREHGFALVVDDTVGTHAALRLLPACDAVCTSLTKMFSGGCNVMGGAVVLNPRSRYHARIKAGLSRSLSPSPSLGEEDDERRAWFWGDVLAMEANSWDFAERVDRASGNAETVVAMLRASRAVAEVYYPLGGPTQAEYDRYRLPGARYGFLLSVRFASPARAVAFYDALDVAKGPSLGTNFTLACAYTLLAHYRELEWAAQYGVVEDLVRISVGLEEREWLQERVGRALGAAEALEG